MALSLDKLLSLATQEGVPPELAAAVYEQESSFGTNTASPNGRNFGGFQVSKLVFDNKVPGGNIDNEEDNARAGLRYLREALDKNNGHFGAAAAYYHAGPKWKEKLEKDPELADSLGKKTFEYANDVVDKAEKFKNLIASRPSVANIGERSLVAGSDRFIPTKSDPQDTINSLVDNLSKSYGIFGKDLEAFRTSNQQLSAGMEAGVVDLVEKLTAQGTAQANEVLVKASNAAQQGLEAKRVLQAGNIDTSDVRNLGVTLLSSMAANTEAAQALRASIQSKAGVSFLEDPITWVQNHFAMSDEIQQHNNLVDNVNADRVKIGQLTSAADELIKSNLAKSGLNDALAAQATVDALRATTDVQIAKVKLEGTRQSYAMANDLFQSTGTQIRLLESQIGVLERSQNLEEKNHAKKLAADADALRLQQANLIAQQLGLPAFSKVSEIDKLPARQKQAFMTLYQSGGLKYGDDPITALSVATSGNVNKMPTGTQVLVDFTRAALERGQREIANEEKLGKQFSKEGRKEAEETKVRTAYDAMQADTGLDLIPNRHENPYRMADFKTMISMPEVAKLPLAAILRKYVEGNPAIVIDDRMIVDIAKQAFVSGTSYKRVEEAATDVSTFFTVAKAYNNQTYNFAGWGLPVQQSYNFKDATGKGIDWSNYSQVAISIARNAGRDMYGKMLEQHSSQIGTIPGGGL